MTPAWPMVGRGDEVVDILENLKRRIGAVVVGDSGVGKTMLAREVQRRLDEDGFQTHLVLCSRWSEFPLQHFEPLDGTPGSPSAPNTIPTVLVVDDAQLLDDESADALWRISTTGAALVVATVRTGEPVPERVARLWADGACERLELAPLDESDIRALLEVVLDGDVEDRLPRFLVQRVGGNALLLREIIRSGLASGAIARSHEVWRLTGELPLGAGVTELIRGRLTDLSAQERVGAELLAIAEPLQLDIAQGEIGASLIDGLEEKRIVALEHTLDGPMLILGHPLYGEVIRAEIAPLRLRRLRLRLIEAIDRVECPGSREILRSALWRVELGEKAAPEELLTAARLARSFGSATAERLARAAFDGDGSFEALSLLAEILLMQGRVAETDRLLDAVDTSSLLGSDLDTVTYLRAMGRTRAGEMSAATMLLVEAASEAESNARYLQAAYAQALILDGRIDEAFAVARPLIDDPESDPIARTLASSTLGAGGALAGNIDESERTMYAALPDAERARAALPFGYGNLKVAAAIAVANSGRLDDAEEIGLGMYNEALQTDDPWLRPRGASALGVVALGRGRPRSATRYFRIAVASLNEYDGLFLCYNLSFLARGAAQAGFVEEARAALQPPEGALRVRFFEADWEIAEAAVLAADGAIGAASEHALQAARLAASMGEWAVALAGAHDAARYGASLEAADLAEVSADRVDGPLPSVISDHARGRAKQDGALLVDVSERFEHLGWMLFAAEAAYGAANAFRSDSDGRAAAAAAVRAEALHAQCEGASIPWVAGFRSLEALTAREHQVALLAAAGQSDASIATQLAISVRTVQNHLARAYAKLGVTSRRELPAAFAAGSVENLSEPTKR